MSLASKNFLKIILCTQEKIYKGEEKRKKKKKEDLYILMLDKKIKKSM